MKQKKKAKIIAVTLLLAFMVILATFLTLRRYINNRAENKQMIEEINYDIAITERFISVIEEQEIAAGKLAFFYHKYGTKQQKEGFKSLGHALALEKNNLKTQKRELEKCRKKNIFGKIEKILSTPIDHYYYFLIAALQNKALTTNAQEAAVVLIGKLENDPELSDDLVLKEIVAELMISMEIIEKIENDLNHWGAD